ncbi:MAG: T9SS C-terminal target domain-containing protein, partial [Bacteroidetes bacterium]
PFSNIQTVFSPPPFQTAPSLLIPNQAITPGFTILSLGDSVICDNIIWPGDANDNGIVNTTDVLYAGIAWGETGAPRPNASANWVGQSGGSDWSFPNFSNGVNHKFADCDGDGAVNNADLNVISLNYGLTHNRLGGHTEASGPLLYLDIPQDSVQAGDTVIADVYLGVNSLPVNDIYGLTFTITYDPILADSGSAAFVATDSWFGTPGQSAVGFSKDFYNQGKVEAAITRINQSNTSGYGKIGSFIFITIDNISGKTLESRLISLGIQPGLAINRNEGVIEIGSGEGDSIVVYQEKTDGISHELQARLRIYPQPARHSVQVEWERTLIQQVSLLTLQGQLLREAEPRTAATELSLGDIPPGAYLLRVEGSEGALQRILLIE